MTTKSNAYFEKFGNCESYQDGTLYYRVNLRTPINDEHCFDVAHISKDLKTMKLWFKKGDFEQRKPSDLQVSIGGVQYTEIRVSKPNDFYGIFKYANLNGPFRFNEVEFEGERYHLAQLYIFEPDGKMYVNFYNSAGAVAKRIVIDHDPPDNPQRWAFVDTRNA